MTLVKNSHRVASTIMYAMMASFAFYIIIVEVLNRTTAQPELLPDVDLTRYIFYAFSVAAIFVTQLVKALMLRNLAGANMEKVLGKLQTANILAAGLAQTPAILGLVMYLVWHQYTDFYMLTFVSLYITVRHFPRYAVWQRVASAAAGGEE